MKYFAKCSLLILLAVSMLTGSALAAGDKSAVSDACNGVVRILVELEDGVYSFGSGFCVGEAEDGKDVFITNWHVVTNDGAYNRPRRVYILLDNSVYSQAYTFLYTDSNGNLINYEDAPFVPGVSYLWDLNLDPSRVVSCDVIYMAKDSSEPDIAILKASQDVPNQTPLPLLAKSEDAPVGSEIYALGFPSDSDSASTVDDNFEPVSEIEDGVYIWQMISETQLLATPSDVTVTDGIISRHTTYGADHIQVIQSNVKSNHGNSGGPMITADGAVVGINTFLTTDSETNTSNFYATAIDYAIEELDALGVSYHLQSVFPLGTVLLVTGVVVLLAAAAVVVTLMVKKRGAAAAPDPFVEPVAPPAQPVASTEPIFQAPPVPPQAPKPQFLVGEGGLMDGKRYPLIPQGILIGRDPSCRICYPANTPGISRKHCQVFWQGGHLMMMDLGSTSGTFVQGRGQITANIPVPLRQGDIFYLGEKRNGYRIV